MRRLALAAALLLGTLLACAAPPASTPASSNAPAARPLVFLADVVAAADRLPPDDPESRCAGRVMVTIDPTPRPPLNLASARFDVSLSGCAADSVITDVHIHKGSENDLVIATSAGSLALTNGAGSGPMVSSSVNPKRIDEIVADTAAFYVNLHSKRHPNGFMRGDLRRGG